MTHRSRTANTRPRDAGLAVRSAVSRTGALASASADATELPAEDPRSMRARSPAFPLDPRDPDILRAKHLLYGRGAHH
jgi:hypothetical protein